MPRSLARTANKPLTGFDFTLHVQRVCADMCARLAELRHIDAHRVAVAYRQTRKAVTHGLQASLTPMRFEGGSLFTGRRGKKWTIQRLYAPTGEEYLYLLNFYLPRFLNLSFDEKLVTIVHELWHIGSKFDGDLRRHPGRCYMHSRSQDDFDAWAAHLAGKWLAGGPPREIYRFLRLNFAQLQRRFGAVFGRRIGTPKLIPVREP